MFPFQISSYNPSKAPKKANRGIYLLLLFFQLSPKAVRSCPDPESLISSDLQVPRKNNGIRKTSKKENSVG
jgi:hypothetical protein